MCPCALTLSTHTSLCRRRPRLFPHVCLCPPRLATYLNHCRAFQTRKENLFFCSDGLKAQRGADSWRRGGGAAASHSHVHTTDFVAAGVRKRPFSLLGGECVGKKVIRNWREEGLSVWTHERTKVRKKERNITVLSIVTKQINFHASQLLFSFSIWAKLT